MRRICLLILGLQELQFYTFATSPKEPQNVSRQKHRKEKKNAIPDNSKRAIKIRHRYSPMTVKFYDWLNLRIKLCPNRATVATIKEKLTSDEARMTISSARVQSTSSSFQSVTRDNKCKQI